MTPSHYCATIDGVSVALSAFEPEQGPGEYFCMFRCERPSGSLYAQANGLEMQANGFDVQLKAILDICQEIVDSGFYGQVEGLKSARPVFKRYYLSDAANQTARLKAIVGEEGCAVTMVQQPPLGGQKVAMMCQWMTDVECERLHDGLFRVGHGGYDELWATQLTAQGKDSYAQADHIMTTYADTLRGHGCTLAANCVRTWLYVNDIDNHYAGVVWARNDVFDEEGLTLDTHFIASTGISGRTADHRSLCMMNALAIRGLRPSQVKYLYALDHLNRTSEYGVRFERATRVDFDGRRKVFVSGTASIDRAGNILYPGDVCRQVERMWQNVEALLAEADCTFDHIVEATVYLRDPADYAAVSRLFASRMPHTPLAIVLAPVCRPGWLVEMECTAVRER